MSSIKGVLSTEYMVVQNKTKAVTSSETNITLGGTNVVSATLIEMDTAVAGVSVTHGTQPSDDINANVTALELISTGTLDIAIDGGAATKIIGMDFNGVANTAAIAAVLVTALAALPVTVTESSDIITITSDTFGATSSVEVTAGTGAGTNVVKADYIVMGTAVDGVDATAGNMPTDDISGNTATIEAIEDGCLDITIDGTLNQVIGLNFDTVSSTAEVAAIIVTAVAALAVTVTEASDVITFTSDSTGATSTIVVAAGTGAGTNVIDTGIITMDTAVDGEDATQGKDLTTDISGNTAAIELVSLGALAISINGATKVEYTGIDLNGVTTVAGIAAIIAPIVLVDGIVVTEDSDIITFSAGTSGVGSTVAVTAGAAAGGTNIVKASYITMDTAVEGVNGTRGKQPTTDISSNVTALEFITGGVLKIAINGATAVNVTGLDFSGITSIADAAVILQEAFTEDGLDVIVEEASDIITIKSNTLGVPSAIAITAGTDLGEEPFIICDALVNATVPVLDMNGEARTLFVNQGERKNILLTKIVSTNQTIIIGN